ncbi:MAG: exosortase/archaeosortase family protein [Puniceicoccales bacterium]|jgi:exosortase/archaeosortase family protein|nr:exosortase/archaeosortase family protein [Puniceicoccales bacterium]
MTLPFAQFEKSFIWAIFFLAACVSVVIWDQSLQWYMREDYTFGYLVPLFFAYVLYERWPALRKLLLGNKQAGKGAMADVPPSRFWDVLVYIGLFSALFFFALGAMMRAISGPNIFATYFNTGGLVVLFLGLAWVFSEKDPSGQPLGFKARRNVLSLLVFPACIWIVSGPLLFLLDTSVRIFLLRVVTIIVSTSLQDMNMNVSYVDNVIFLPRFLPDGTRDSVGVADACSGVRSLTACIFMGAVLSAVFLQGIKRKSLLLLFSIFAAFVLNVLRTVFLTMWAYQNGSPALEADFQGNAPGSVDFSGSVHDVAGYVAMGFTFVILLASIPILNLRLKRSDEEMRCLRKQEKSHRKKKKRSREMEAGEA